MRGYGETGVAEAVADAAMRQVEDKMDKLGRDLKKDIERWTAENGFTPADRTSALALVDELKSRGVKSFEGLGIKVEL